jgi:hypothetical protein
VLQRLKKRMIKMMARLKKMVMRRMNEAMMMQRKCQNRRKKVS